MKLSLRYLISITAAALSLIVIFQLTNETQTEYTEQERVEYQKFCKELSKKDLSGNDLNFSSADKPDQAKLQNFIMTANPFTKEIPYDAYLKVQEELENGNFTEALEIEWEERGPIQVGGRTRALMFDPNDASNKKVWAGSVSGGLWYTNDIIAHPPVWNKVDDFWDNLAITTITFDPNNSNVFYAGTGEGRWNHDAVKGAGIWKSTDAGSSWNRLPSTNNLDFDFIQKIVVHPVTSDVYAATRSTDNSRGGLMRSNDGGLTWDDVLSTSSSGVHSITNRAADIEIVADNSIMAAFGIFEFDNIYWSPNGNEGNWFQIDNGIPAHRMRVELATAPSDASIAYAAVEDSNRSLIGIFKSTNKGVSWNQVETPMMNTTTTFAKEQAWYDLILRVHPTNPDRLLAGAVTMHSSKNGGSSWSQVYYIHADHHEILFRPGSTDEVIFGNDGGVYYTDDVWKTLPAIWDKNEGYKVTQFYSCTMHPVSGVNYFLGGTQDNGTLILDSPGMDFAHYASGGDGGYCFVDQILPRYQFVSYTNNTFHRSTDHGENFINITSDGTGRFINPADYDPIANIIYSARDSSSIKRIRNARYDYFEDSIYGLPLNDLATAIRLSPYEANTIYVGVTGGKLFKITDADGPTWNVADITPAVFPPGYLSSIEFGVSENQIAVTFSNYGITSIFETTDQGLSWQSREGDLPDMPVRSLIYNPINRSQVMVATEVGVWYTEDFTAAFPHWQPANNGMPNVRTDMLKVRQSDYQVLAATHGRGMFSTNAFAVIKSEKLLASNGGTGDLFGQSIAVSGNFAIVGAPAFDVVGENSGAVYIFEKNISGKWIETQQLFPAQPYDGAHFGRAVDIDGIYAVVGAMYDNQGGTDAGAAYIYKFDGSNWNEIKKITASDAEPNDRFGASVGIYADIAVIGAPGESSTGSYAGAAYIFKSSGDIWGEVQKIIYPNASANDAFGVSCAIRENEIFIGAINESHFSGGSGAVVTFLQESGNWNFKQILYHQSGSVGDLFGGSIEVYQDNLIVGAIGCDNEHESDGAAVIYNKSGSTWQAVDSLLCPDPEDYGYFGSSVSIFENLAVVGAEGDYDNGIGSGSTYVYEFDGTHWVNKIKLLAEDGTLHDNFGNAIALFGSNVLVSSFHDDDKGENSGSVYSFDNITDSITFGMLSVNNFHAVSNNSQSYSIRVRNSGTGIMNWHTYAESDWFTITSGSGTNSGNIQIEILENDYCARREEIMVTAPGAINSPQVIVIEQEEGIGVTQQKILSDSISMGDRFGWAVAVDENQAVIASVEDNQTGTKSGAAYVFERSGCNWNQVATLASSDLSDYDLFGHSVDIKGDQIIIGAPGNVSSYVFQKPAGGWTDMTETAKFEPSHYGGEFGRSVAITNDAAIVGAWGSNSIFIYNKNANTWTSGVEDFFYHNTDFGYFGFSVDIDNEYAVVGAYDARNTANVACGAVYIFIKDWYWSFLQKITPSEANENDRFGLSVAIDDKYIVAGSPYAKTSLGYGHGAAYIFEKGGVYWNESKIILSDPSSYNSRFGSSIDICGNTIIVGAPLDNPGIQDAGAAYTFDFDGSDWNQSSMLVAQDTTQGDQFGYSVGITKYYNICGAYGNGDFGEYTGSAYIFCNTSDITVSVENESEAVPVSNSLGQNYPNPFNPSTNIEFSLRENSYVTLDVFDLLGQRVIRLINDEYRRSGKHNVKFNAHGLSSGIYFYVIEIGDKFRDVKKMLLVK